MFKLSSVASRYFKMEAPDNHRVLHIEPPKLKTLKRLNAWGKNRGSVDEAAQIVAAIISKNREGRNVSADMVMTWMNSDQLSAFLGEFLSWLNNTKANDPN